MPCKLLSGVIPAQVPLSNIAATSLPRWAYLKVGVRVFLLPRTRGILAKFCKFGQLSIHVGNCTDVQIPNPFLAESLFGFEPNSDQIGFERTHISFLSVV